jgi:hypothetical protein
MTGLFAVADRFGFTYILPTIYYLLFVVITIPAGNSVPLL